MRCSESKEWTELETGEDIDKVTFIPRLDFAMTTLVVPKESADVEAQDQPEPEVESKTYLLLHGKTLSKFINTKSCINDIIHFRLKSNYKHP